RRPRPPGRPHRRGPPSCGPPRPSVARDRARRRATATRCRRPARFRAWPDPTPAGCAPGVRRGPPPAPAPARGACQCLGPLPSPGCFCYECRSRRVFPCSRPHAIVIRFNMASTAWLGPWRRGQIPKHAYFFGFRSRLRRLTISEAVRFISLPEESLGGAYIDQITWRDLASTRNSVPRARLKPELVAGLLRVFSVFRSRAGAGGSSSGLAVFFGLAGFSGAAGSSAALAADSAATGFWGSGGLGAGENSSNCAWKPSLMWSVRMASASLGSVTTWKIYPLVSWFARYWSIPRAIGSRYTECTPARSAAHANAPTSGNRHKHRFMVFIIATGFYQTRTARARKKSAAAGGSAV